MDKGLEFMDTKNDNNKNESEKNVLKENDFYDKEIMEVDNGANLLDDDFESIGEELNNDNFSAFVGSNNEEELKPAEFDTPVLADEDTGETGGNTKSSSNETLNKTVQTKENNESSTNQVVEADSNDVLSDFDSLFNNLYSDVVGANNFISNLIEKKTSLNKNEKSLEEIKEKFEK